MRPLLALLVLAAGIALFLRIAEAWRLTARREAYLPQLEAQARRSAYDGPLLALLGARQAQAQDPQAAANLVHALAAGEQGELVWRTLAAVYISSGDRVRAMGTLRKGRETLHGFCPSIDAATQRLQTLGPKATPSDLALAICPEGPDALAAAYTPGSFLDGVSAWWGRSHPEQSGFATRQEWAREEPKNAEAQRLWGLALLKNRRAPEAAQALVKAVALAPGSADAHLGLAQALEAGGRSNDAAAEYLQALKLRPNFLPTLLGLGRSSQSAGLRYARLAFRRATQTAPNSVEAWIGLGRADVGHDEFLVECLQAFGTAAKLAPSRTDFDADYAVALNRNGKPEEAERLLRRRLASTPDDAAAHFHLGKILSEGKPTPERLAEAEAQTRETLQLAPHNALTETQLGDVLLRERKAEEAAQALQQALKDDPKEVEAHRLLARAYGQAGKSALAAQTAARADELFRAEQQIDVLANLSEQRFLDPAYHLELIRLYQQTGQASEALREKQTLSMLQANPSAASKSYRDLQELVRVALSDSGMPTR